MPRSVKKGTSYITDSPIPALVFTFSLVKEAKLSSLVTGSFFLSAKRGFLSLGRQCVTAHGNLVAEKYEWNWRWNLVTRVETRIAWIFQPRGLQIELLSSEERTAPVVLNSRRSKSFADFSIPPIRSHCSFQCCLATLAAVFIIVLRDFYNFTFPLQPY